MPSARGPPLVIHRVCPYKESPESNCLSAALSGLCRIRARAWHTEECTTMAEQSKIVPIRSRMNPIPLPLRQKDATYTHRDLAPTVRQGDIYFFTAPSASTAR